MAPRRPPHGEYFTPSPRVQWYSVVSTDSLYEDAQVTGYPADQVTEEDWNGAAVGPWIDVFRCDDRLGTTVDPFSSSAAGHHTSVYDATGQSTLLSGGDQLGTGDDPQNTVFTGLPDAATPYTLKVTATRSDPATELATKVDAEWTFRSARDTDCTDVAAEVPVLTARIDGDFDLANAAPAGQPFPVAITVGASDGSMPAVRDVALEATYDDGATWHAVATTGEGTAFSALVPAAPGGTGNGYVGLRTTVGDDAGDGLRQTVIRAYQQR